MHRRSGRLVFSPTDLAVFVRSPFASWMDRLAIERPGAATPAEADATAELVFAKGIDHERRFLEGLRARGEDVTDVSNAEDRAAATDAAMREGRGVVYQAALRSGAFEGYADFLVRVDRPSRLGAWSYEPWDTKLSHAGKPEHLVQLCAYADMLEGAQGVRPSSMSLVLGTGERVPYRTDDFFHAYRSVKRAFLEAQEAFDPDAGPLPDPDADHGCWSDVAERMLDERDHLSRVANATGAQVRRLEQAGIETMRQLADSRLDRVPRMDPAVFARLRAQARLQIASAGRDRPVWEIVEPDPAGDRLGLAALPPPSPLDVYFDMEGHPFAPGGLEYLFGASFVDGGARAYRDVWAHDAGAEKRAFEDFVDWATDRFRRDPGMHVYHYAAYEVSALRRLMGRHGTREDEVDALLRAEAFVDLYRIVRQSIRVGEASYSLKHVERLYRPARAGEVREAGESIVEYERWREAPDGPDVRTSAILAAIRDYNRDDCDSLAALAAWLRTRQKDAGIAWAAPRRPAGAVEPGPDAAPTPAAEVAARLEARADGLRARADAAGGGDSEGERIARLLSFLVDFHRRENKPVWWAMFDRAAMAEEALIDDPACLGGLVRTDRTPTPDKRSFLHEYRFDPDQDTKLAPGDECVIASDLDRHCHIASLDGDRGRVEIRFGSGKPAPPGRLSLLPWEFVNPKVIAESILATAEAFAASGTLPPAIDHFLRRERPRIRGRAAGASVLAPGKDPLDAAIEAVAGLDGSSLCIQGPPGSGKTYTAARIVARLVRDGRRVGIASNSHKAILNLMRAVVRAAREADVRARMVKIGGDDDDEILQNGDVDHVEGVKDVDLDGPDAPMVVGGTAWAFASPRARGRFDTLFVDEAGQVSVANLVGMAPAARNLVLVGDQMQLAQPVQGSHPGESGLSALAYLLGDRATIPDDLGIFLATTWRLHPEICRFVSEGVYEGRLRPVAGTKDRVVRVPRGGGTRIRAEAGVVFVPVDHEGNTQASDEEVEVVREVVREIVGRTFGGGGGKLRLDDILVVAPYNAQVRRLREALGPEARVGSVDKFQGQEAAVVIVSMCASSGDASPRGIEFLFSRERLNVAISRARSLAIVVGSPRLARTRCATVDQMRLVNLFCRVVDGA